MTVFVSVAPQKYFVQQIGKESLTVEVMVQPGASPHTYEPRPRQMRELAKAVLYFAVGVPFEKTWLTRIHAANPGMRVVHTDRGIEKIPMLPHHHDAEEGGRHQDADHDPEDGGLDPHIWLSPALVKVQARTIMAALQKANPSRADEYKTNYDRFIRRIDVMDLQFRQIFAGKKGLAFMAFHPSWGYFAADYGIEQLPIEMEGKSPKPAQLGSLIQQARHRAIKVIFVQPQFSTKSAELIARAIGGRVVFADPLAENWMSNLEKAAVAFKAALR